MKKHIVTIALALVLGISLGAQEKAPAKGFTIGKWMEIQNSVRQNLNRYYVDTLPLARMERASLDALLGSLDPYTVYVPEEEQEDFNLIIGKTYGGIGAVIYKPEKDGNVIINEPYAGSPAARAGLRCGDEIITIDGQSTHGLTSQQASDKMRGKPGTPVAFKIKKVYSGKEVDITIVRERIHFPDVEYAGMLNDTTGYISQSGFTEGVSGAVRESVLKLKEQGMKKLVLDLRGNGGGLVDEAVKIISLFVPKGTMVLSSKGNTPESEEKFYTTHDPIDLKLPIVVLVDSGSASASEIVAGGLQDLDRATVMGRRSFGKGLVQRILPLPYGGELKVTIAKYYTPSGRCVQAIDYASRNEDGSVGHIPDSLTHEFKTAGGRIVRDGGGITPDVLLTEKVYGRLVYSVVLNGITDQYALDYVRRHENVPAFEDFHFTDEDYKDFVAFAKDKKFDYRTDAKASFDHMKKQLEKDGFADRMKDQLDAMEKALEMDKETFLNIEKDELIPFIEQEIAVRYWFQEAGVKVRLRYDDQLREALSKPLAI